MSTRTSKRLTFAVAGVLFLVGSGVAVAAADLPVPGQPIEEPATAPAAGEATESDAAPAHGPSDEPSPISTDAADSESSDAGDPRQQWADSIVEAYFGPAGLDSERADMAGFRYIESWESPAPGELVFHVSPRVTENDQVYNQDLGPANSLWLIGAEIMDRTAGEYPELQKITAETTDGERVETYTREDYTGPQVSGDNKPGTRQWANELVRLWLDAEGVSSVEGMLPPFDLITSWAATGDSELTVYTDPAILTDDRMSSGDYGHHYGIAMTIWNHLYCGAPDLESVVVVTYDGQALWAIDRSDVRAGAVNGARGCRS